MSLNDISTSSHINTSNSVEIKEQDFILTTLVAEIKNQISSLINVDTELYKLISEIEFINDDFIYSETEGEKLIILSESGIEKITNVVKFFILKSKLKCIQNDTFSTLTAENAIKSFHDFQKKELEKIHLGLTVSELFNSTLSEIENRIELLSISSNKRELLKTKAKKMYSASLKRKKEKYLKYLEDKKNAYRLLKEITINNFKDKDSDIVKKIMLEIPKIDFSFLREIQLNNEEEKYKTHIEDDICDKEQDKKQTKNTKFKSKKEKQSEKPDSKKIDKKTFLSKKSNFLLALAIAITVIIGSIKKSTPEINTDIIDVKEELSYNNSLRNIPKEEVKHFVATIINQYGKKINKEISKQSGNISTNKIPLKTNNGEVGFQAKSHIVKAMDQIIDYLSFKGVNVNNIEIEVILIKDTISITLIETNK